MRRVWVRRNSAIARSDEGERSAESTTITVSAVARAKRSNRASVGASRPVPHSATSRSANSPSTSSKSDSEEITTTSSGSNRALTPSSSRAVSPSGPVAVPRSPSAPPQSGAIALRIRPRSCPNSRVSNSAPRPPRSGSSTLHCSGVKPSDISVTRALRRRLRRTSSTCSRRASPLFPPTSAALDRSESNPSNLLSHCAAVFGPTPGIPGRLSEVSPTNAASSG